MFLTKRRVGGRTATIHLNEKILEKEKYGEDYVVEHDLLHV